MTIDVREGPAWVRHPVRWVIAFLVPFAAILAAVAAGPTAGPLGEWFWAILGIAGFAAAMTLAARFGLRFQHYRCPQCDAPCDDVSDEAHGAARYRCSACRVEWIPSEDPHPSGGTG